MNNRPGNSEIAKRVYEASDAIAAGKCSIGVPAHYSRDCAELEIADEEEFWNLVLGSLEEIKQGPPHRCYAGHRPPEIAGEVLLKGLPLWAYCWISEHCDSHLKAKGRIEEWDKQMYLKFAIQKDEEINWYKHVDIHKSKS